MNFIQARVENAIKATAEPILINENCVNLRENRVDTDVVYDKVEKDLNKEIETTMACRELLNTTRNLVLIRRYPILVPNTGIIHSTKFKPF